MVQSTLGVQPRTVIYYVTNKHSYVFICIASLSVISLMPSDTEQRCIYHAGKFAADYNFYVTEKMVFLVTSGF